MPTSPTTRYDYVPVGTVWPSGDFSVGHRRIEWGDRSADKVIAFDPAHFDGEAPEYTSTTDAIQMWLSTPEARTQVYAEMQDAWENPGALDDWLGPLDLTDVRNSHSFTSRPEKYGRLGMTGYGKKMVRSACAILERRFRNRLTFATVTMPTLPPDLRRELALVWPELVRQLLQWLSRRLSRKRLPSLVCSVSEVQPKRIQAGNGGYLHLHLVWPNIRNQGGFYTVHPLEVRSWCESFLARRGLLTEGGWVNCDTQDVKKSAAAYLSKYMSKGGEVLEEFARENGWDAVPGQWWNLTKPARDAVKAEVVKSQAVGEWLNAMIDYALEFCDGQAFWSLRTVDMEYDGRFITVGYCGILKAEHQRDLVQMHAKVQSCIA